MRGLPTLLSAGLLVAALGAAASAQDPNAPRIDAIISSTGRTLNPPRTTLGQVIVLQGANFWEAPEGEETRIHEMITVEIGNAPATVLGSTETTITVLIPNFGIDTGNKRLEVEVKDRGRTRMDIEILTPEEYNSDVEANREGGMETGSGVAPDTEERIRQSFRISRFELQRDQGTVRFEVEGSAAGVPDGFSVQLMLLCNDRPVEPRKVRIENNAFSATFGPYTENLLLGTYSVNMLFELGKQSRVRSRRFVRGLSDEEQQVYERILRREIAVVGSQVEIAEQQRQIQEHYIEVANQAERLLGELQTAFGCACRTFFRPPGSSSYDEQEYRGYIERMGFATTPSALDDMSSDTTYARRTGQIKPDEYGRFLEEVLFGEVPHNGQETLVTLYRKHLEFVERFMTSPDERSDLHVDYLVSIVVQLGRDWSRRLYTHEGLEVPGVVEGTRIRPEVAPEITQRFFRARRRMLLRQIGRSDLVEGDGEDG